MFEEDKTVLSPREEPKKPVDSEIPETPVLPSDATIMSEVPGIPEIPEIPVNEDATVVSAEPISFDMPVMDETPVTPEIPVMEEIPPIEMGSEPASGKKGDSSKNWMGIVSLVAGVLSLCGIIFAPVGCIFSIGAIVLGILGMKSEQKTLAIIGLVIGGIGILVSLVAGVIQVLALAGPSMGNVFSEILTEMESGY
ncbi:MAG: hypothetical protein V2J07_04445 [Anaerolineae bacterium]|jgi:hypothetical protein|nr:hypothetical protein [Anaerolineae bacterium]